MPKIWAGLFALVAATAVTTAAGARRTATHAYAEPAWSPNGRQIAFIDRRGGGLFVVRPDGTHLRTVLPVGTTVAYPAWAPRSRKLAVTGVATLNVDGTGWQRLENGCCPDWSPRGRKIAFVEGGESGGAEIWSMNPDGSHEALVAAPDDGLHSFSMPTWSPNGQRLALSIGSADAADATRSLGIVSSYRGRVRHVLASYDPWEPDWSPDGSRIAFSDRMVEIDVWNLRTGRVHELHAGEHPRWSPTSRQIVFSYRGGIYVMDARGKHAREIVSSAG